MKKKTVADVDVQGKQVLLRADFNVPLNPEGVITDDSRIRATLPTIRHLLEQGASVVAMSHLGRPGGSVNEKLRMAPVARRLTELLERPVKQVSDCIGAEVETAARELKPGEILLLENLRFHPEEEANDPAFAKALAGLGDMVINDAFGTAHRAHASVVGIADSIPAAAGFLLAREIDYFTMLNEHPDRPYIAILGGAKVKDKIEVIFNLIKKVDSIIIGGAMAYTFLQVQGQSVGASRVDKEHLDTARKILDEAAELGVPIELPVDHVITKRFAPDAAFQISSTIPDGFMGLDIGPETVKRYANCIRGAKTAVWNGPMGVFEWDNFGKGTLGVATALSNMDGVSVACGGDSVAALYRFGLDDEVSHMSTGGGASLEILEGRELPGLAVLDK